MTLFVNGPLIWRIYDDSDDEDRDDFLVKEIRCCNCFLDRIFYILDKEITFETLRREVKPPSYCKGDVYMFFSEISIFSCERSKVIFEEAIGLNKQKMDENCEAPSIDYCCLYFLSRESWIHCICKGCQRTILKLVSERLIKVKT